MSGCIRALYVLLMIGTAGVLMIAVPRLVETVAILVVRVHRVNDTGRAADCWNVFSPHRIRPLAVSARSLLSVLVQIVDRFNRQSGCRNGV